MVYHQLGGSSGSGSPYDDSHTAQIVLPLFTSRNTRVTSSAGVGGLGSIRVLVGVVITW